ncbi:MAG: hypothetical protein ABSD38_38875 [Syntrophorhabdales bacterium]
MWRRGSLYHNRLKAAFRPCAAGQEQCEHDETEGNSGVMTT